MQNVNFLCCKIILQRTDDDKWEFLLGHLSGSIYLIEIVAYKGIFYVIYQGPTSPTFFLSPFSHLLMKNFCRLYRCRHTKI